MLLYYCGFSGFKQCLEDNAVQKSYYTCPVVALKEANFLTTFDVSWNSVCWVKESGALEISGFVDETESKKTVQPPKDDGFIQVYCSRSHTLCITRKGICYVINHVISSKSSQPIRISNKKIKTGDITEYGAFVVDEDGKSYELKWKKDFESLETTPLCISPTCRVTAVSCGKEHQILLTENGTVFTFGQGSRGQLGHRTLNSEEEPKALEALEGLFVMSISAGGWHSAAVTDVGDAYFWGWNESGQIGLPFRGANVNSLDTNSDEDYVSVQCVPHLLELLDMEVISASCGSRHSAILSGDGRVLTFGWNGYGQLGKENCKSSHIPEEVSFFRKENLSAVSIKCGDWSTLVLAAEVGHRDEEMTHGNTQ